MYDLTTCTDRSVAFWRREARKLPNYTGDVKFEEIKYRCICNICLMNEYVWIWEMNIGMKDMDHGMGKMWNKEYSRRCLFVLRQTPQLQLDVIMTRRQCF